jgi:hypothetical protein
MRNKGKIVSAWKQGVVERKGSEEKGRGWG